MSKSTLFPSPNFNIRRAIIDMVVIHYTGMKTAADAYKRLCCRESEVSAHYLIDQDGTAIQLVADSKRAWHAGVSYWQGQTDINSRSIGIELVNTGYEPFSEPQMQALEVLLIKLMRQYSIQPIHVVGHSDVAIGRKIDPGVKFDWLRLERQGLAYDRRKSKDVLGYYKDDHQKLTAALALRFGS